jgi:ubiquinone/menaquinone biosynthesis C-methylase UbiE
MAFMNYGWAALDPQAETLPLRDEDEGNRYCIQLYDRVVGAIDLSGLDVLEVGCGRGGGASYLARYLGPRSVKGVDITRGAIKFCDSYYDLPNLSFARAKAESLQLEDNSFDVVINIESSHCYGSMDRFLGGVRRVLKPEGRFLWADFRQKDQISSLYDQLRRAGLALIGEERITPNVVRALELDNDRKQELIRRKVRRVLHGVFNEFAGMQGTDSAYTNLGTGAWEYLAITCRKAALSSPA